MNDFTVFVKEPGGELQRYVAHDQEDYMQAMTTVRDALEKPARVMVDLSLTVPSKAQTPELEPA